MDLTPQEIRVVGCLLEKERTTPDPGPDLEVRVAALERAVAELQERLDR